MEITQKTIQDGIKALVDNVKWGAPSEYDITITKSGEGLDTSYQVMPNPHEDVDENIKVKYEGMNINLEALFTGADPFAK